MTLTDLRLKGEPGIWLSAPLGACVLRDLEQLQMTRDQNALLEQSLDLSEAESRVLRQSNGQLRLSLENTETALTLQTKQTRSAEKKARKSKRRGIISAVMIGLAGTAAGIGVGMVLSH
jgi:hypothetical protein